MRKHNYFVEGPLADVMTYTLKDKDIIHQWKKVLRYAKGQEVVLFDGSPQEFHGTIDSLDQDAEIAIKSVYDNIVSRDVLSKKEVCLFVSLIKKDKFEWVVQKGTELGVTRFIPVESHRSEKKNINLDRLLKIAQEASEQSGRSVLPKIESPVSLKDAVSQIQSEYSFVLETGDVSSIKNTLPTDWKSVSCFIGPEGGWSESDLLILKDIEKVSLGSQVLRAETCSIGVAAYLLLGN